MLRQGPPPENTRFKKSTIYIGMFAILGILIFLFIILFRASLLIIGKSLNSTGGLGLVDGVLVLIISIPISIIQTSVLKDSISASKIIPFIGSAAFAGFLAGFFGGTIINAFSVTTKFLPGIPVGSLIGGTFGFFSSVIQALFMRNKEYTFKWIVYSVLSNIAVWSIGWAVGWLILGLTGAAVSSALMMFISGISLSIFLNTTNIEF